MTLRLKHVGQLEDATVEFGDLTVLVGPQASGKSVFLQFLKLLLDMGKIIRDVKRYGLNWKGTQDFLDLYLGEGMGSIWKPEGHGSALFFPSAAQAVTLDLKLKSAAKGKHLEKVFFIPAQRVLALSNGWPKSFSDFRLGDPYVVRAFSENLRFQMEVGLGKGERIFPEEGRLKSDIRAAIDNAIFRGFSLKLDRQGIQKRLVLSGSNGTLPFMVWSAGQREFVPLLLGLYWLLPPGGKIQTRKGIEWVVIEELEMGLHPRAISAVMLLVLDLLRRGYKVVLSTHSNHVLDVVWALQVIKEMGAETGKVLEIFKVRHTPPMMKLAENVLQKTYRVFYLDDAPLKGDTNAKDISGLNPGASASQESGWGGLSEFSGRIADVVASVVANREKDEG